MKRIVFSLFLAALLSSCGANYLSGGNEISVRMKSGAQNDYKLLSVRDSSLVVMDAKEDAQLENSFSHAESIRFDSIYKVYRGYSNSTSRLIGGGLLAVSGIWLGISASTPEKKETGIGAMANLGQGIVIAVFGITGIVMFAGSSDLQLHPIYAKDKEILRQISAYPNGEPEMLKLVR
jgi:hypothetical protein